MKAVVFASGSGTNFEALMQRQNAGDLDVEIVGLVVDKEGAFARERARRYELPERWFNPRAYPSKADYEAAILAWCRELGADMVILSGYMRIVGSTLLRAYPDAIVNIHPAMLPCFPGAHAILDAYQARVPATGVTVHYIDDQIDSGPVILQEEVAIDPAWSLEELESAVHAREYDLFWRAINKAAGQIENRKNEKKEEKEA